MNKKDTITLELPDKCSRCSKEPYGWFIENNKNMDFIALCWEHLIDFTKSTEKYELKRN